MPLSAGDKLGPYEILAPIGAGGMGEVYKARDTKLDREVAIKVLPASLARDPERLARFEREAKVLASLNHPNIAQIYGIHEGIGDSPAARALIMELVPGHTLKGPLPLDETLRIATQIAEALDAAHEKGIVHRDLKPANIMVTPIGVVKVLDFGLAAVTQPSASSSSVDPSQSPTVTMGLSQVGMIVGTAGYMAPEQAAGQAVDKRADIWAFGVVLWEMLTGERLFTGDTVAHILASVLTKEPDWERVPFKLRRLLRACLQKEPRQRLQAIGDWKLLIADDAPAAPAPAQPPSRLRWLWPGVAALAIVCAIGVSFIHFREAPEATLRYTIAAPEGATVHSFSLSPDGRTLVIAAAVNGKQQLWLRAMDALQAQAMAFTEEATYPFWSPDSRQIGFFAQGKLKRIAASGGPAQSLCDALNGRGGSWNRDDVILFSPGYSGISIQRVAASGGVPVEVTKTKGNLEHPAFLPDGRHFLYSSLNGTAEQVGIYVSSLDGKENRRILADVSSAMFAPPANGGHTGHILFVRENTLMAAPFDAASPQLAGDVFPLVEGVAETTDVHYLPVAVSGEGVLLYETGGSRGGNQIGWFDRSGKSLGPVGAPGLVWDPAISPDEKSVAFRRLAGDQYDLWIRDLSRGTETRVTNDSPTNIAPSWSPVGDRIVFASNRKGQAYNLYLKAAVGSGQDEVLLPNTVADLPTQWSRDGRFIVYTETDVRNKRGIWVLPMEGAATDRKPTPFLRTDFHELHGHLSPDSRWMAFASDRSGRREVYVRPFPPADGEWTISIDGGEQPRWRGDGKELFFEAADGKIMAVSVKAATGTKPSFEAGTPVALFDAHMATSANNVLIEYDVTADGKRFLIATTGASGAASPPLTVVTNWTAGLKK